MKKLLIIVTFIVTLFGLNGCKKEVEQKEDVTTMSRQSITLSNKPNPFSVKNIKEVKSKRKVNTAQRQLNVAEIDADRVWVYVQFNPDKVTGDLLARLEADSNIHIMDFPFANFELYNDDFALDEAKAEHLKDGKLYAVYKKTSLMNDLFINETSLETVFLDELYLPEESESTDTQLYIEALINAGYTQDEANRWFKICLFKRPKGHINYFDTELNSFQPVVKMQVWALVFGIPVTTYTDVNGYYSIPWLFSAGTIMGTKAKNNRVNIKPLNTRGIWVATLHTQFIVGSVHIEGWKSSCDMRNDINMNFNGHTQVRFWSHILNAYYLHDQYTAQDGILSAPSSMVCYAGWTNDGNSDVLGRPTINDAGTPMFGHINYNLALWEFLLNDIFGANVNLSVNFPNLFNLLGGLMPDMYIGLAGSQEPSFYSSRIMQTAFHELAHASQYRRVGNAWYTLLQWAERPLSNVAVPGNPYGDGTRTNAGIVSLAESWAEFLGCNYEIRRYGNAGRKQITNNGALNGNPFIGQTYGLTTDLIEREGFFYEGGNWIPYGVYHDLIDNFNGVEPWDEADGSTISDLYNTFAPNIKTRCDYAAAFLGNNPNISANGGLNLMIRYNMVCW